MNNTRNTIRATPRTPRGYAFTVALSLLSSLLVTACGGGGASDAAAPPLAGPQGVAASVQLEGCVVDAQWMGAADVAVHVRTADGRAVGTAFTNQRGVFVLGVPARAGIVVDTGADAQGGLALNTGSTALSVASCLLAGI